MKCKMPAVWLVAADVSQKQQLPADRGQVHDYDLEADDDQNRYEYVSNRAKVVDFEQLSEQGFTVLEFFSQRNVLLGP